MYFKDIFLEIDQFVSANNPAWIFLEGDLGAGKTTLVQEYCRKISGDQVPVQSPTFLKILEYSIDHFGSVVHMDFYRVEDHEEIFRFGLESYDRARIFFLEWPSVFCDFLKAHESYKDLLQCDRILSVVLDDQHRMDQVRVREITL